MPLFGRHPRLLAMEVPEVPQPLRAAQLEAFTPIRFLELREF